MKVGLYPIPGFDGYFVTKTGNVYSNYSGEYKKLKKRTDKDGYFRINLYRNGCRYEGRIHLLVLKTFIGPRPVGLQARHLDGNNQNNNLENLCWGTAKENRLDQKTHNTENIPLGSQHYRTVLTEETVKKIKLEFKNFPYNVDLAKKYNTTPAVISQIRIGATWKHVEI